MVLLFLDLGFFEILVVLFFVLIFFGAESIPSVARSMGRIIRQVRDTSSELQQDIANSAKKIKEDIQVENTIESTAKETVKNINKDT